MTLDYTYHGLTCEQCHSPLMYPDDQAMVYILTGRCRQCAERAAAIRNKAKSPEHGWGCSPEEA